MAEPDPTKNVLDLVEAAVKRLDDLRIASNERTRAESAHTREVMALHEKYAAQLREAEAKRIDAIRTVDVNAVAAARADAEARASALAGQVANQAEAVRVGLAAALEPIQKDIADLRRSQYEGVGGSAKVAETQARSGNLGLWVGIGVAAVVGLLALAATMVGLIYTVTSR